MPDQTISLTIKINDDGSVVFSNFSDSLKKGLESISNSAQKTSEALENIDKKTRTLADGLDVINSPFTKLVGVFSLINNGLEILGKGLGFVFGLFQAGLSIVERATSAFFDFGKNIIKVTEDFEKFSLLLSASVGPARGGALAQITKEIADISPLLEKDVRQIVQSLSLVPAIQAQLQTVSLDKLRGELGKTVEAVQALSVFRPDQGPQGALFAFREFLQGDFRSLAARFDVGIDAVIQTTNSSLQKLKSSASERRRVFEEFAKNLVPPETQAELSKTPALLVEGAFEQLNNFLIRIGDINNEQGFFKTVKNFLNTAFETIKGALTAESGPFADLAKTAGKLLTDILNQTIERTSTVTNKIIDLFVSDGDKGKNIVEKIGLVLLGMIQRIDQALPGIIKFIDDLSEKLVVFVQGLDFNQIKGGLIETFETIREIVSAVFSLIKEALPILKEIAVIFKNNPLAATAGTVAAVGGVQFGASALGAAAGGAVSGGVAALGTGIGAAAGAGSLAAIAAGGIAAVVSSVLAVLATGAAFFALGSIISNTIISKQDELEQKANEAQQAKRSEFFGSTSGATPDQLRAVRLAGNVKRDLNILQDRFGQDSASTAETLLGQDTEIPEFGPVSRFREQIRKDLRELQSLGVGIPKLTKEGLDILNKTVNGVVEQSNKALTETLQQRAFQAPSPELTPPSTSSPSFFQAPVDDSRRQLQLSQFSTQQFGLLFGSSGSLSRESLVAPQGRASQRNESLLQSLAAALENQSSAVEEFAGRIKNTVFFEERGTFIKSEEQNKIIEAGKQVSSSIVDEAVRGFVDSLTSQFSKSRGPEEVKAIFETNSDIRSRLENNSLVTITSQDIEALKEAFLVEKDLSKTVEERTQAATDLATLQVQITEKSLSAEKERLRILREVGGPSNQIQELEGNIRNLEVQLGQRKDTLNSTVQKVNQALLGALNTVVNATQSLLSVSGATTEGALSTGVRNSERQIETVGRNPALSGVANILQEGVVSSANIGSQRIGLSGREADLKSAGGGTFDEQKRIAEESLRLSQEEFQVQSRINDALVSRVKELKDSGQLKGEDLLKAQQILDTEQNILDKQKDQTEQAALRLREVEKELAVRRDINLSLRAGLQDAQKAFEQENPFRDFAKEGATGLRDSLASAISDGIETGGENAQRIFDNLLQNLAQQIQRAAIQQLSNLAVKGLINLGVNILGSVFGGGGGAAGVAGGVDAGSIGAGVGAYAKDGGIFPGTFKPLQEFNTSGIGAYAKDGGIFPGTFFPLQAFASGGVVSRPTVGLIGEGGSPEAVVPLPNGKSIPVEMSRSAPPKVNNTIINSVDPNFVRQVVLDNDGEVVMNVIGLNPGKVRQLIGVPAY